MSNQDSSDTLFLISFFAAAIGIGTFLLALPLSWIGPGPGAPRLALVDALFIATSAVCVTGLSTVNVSDFSRYGQVVVLLLIQVGGLGIISFTSLLIVMPGRRLPFRRLGTIRGFSVDAVECDPVRVVRNIMLFSAVFHSVSAFFNAGLSLYPTNMEAFSRNPLLLGILSVLIVTGGIGFIVLQDIERRLRGKRHVLSYHSKLILAVTAFLILFGALAFWLLEKDKAYAGMGALDKVANALFQSITPRTAGLSLNFTAGLGAAGKLVIIATMSAGRVGLIALTFPSRERGGAEIVYPEAEILVG